MSSWNLICEKFIEEKLNDLEDFSYFEFVELFNDKDKARIGLFYIKVLDELIQRAPTLRNLWSIKKKNFTKRNNRRSVFGKEYLDYWKDREDVEHESKLRKRAMDMKEDAQRRVIRRVTESFSGDPTDQNYKAEREEKEEDWTKTVIRVLNDTKDTPSCILSSIKILDMTNERLMRIIEGQLEEKEYTALKEKSTLKEWTPDGDTANLLKSISDCKPSFHAMRRLSRTPVLPPEEFDSSVHHNLLTVESVFLNFLNILEFNGPLVSNEYYERTCALSVVVPVLNALFMKFRSLSTKWFEIQTNFTSRHLFDGVIIYDGILEPMALAEFGGARCSDDKVNNETLKVYRNGLRVLNEIAAKTKHGKTPKVSIVLFHKAILRFETLLLLDDCTGTYVRTRHAKMQCPKTPEELKLVFPELKKAISWRDALVQNIAR